jgi:hypothetical protein
MGEIRRDSAATMSGNCDNIPHYLDFQVSDKPD